VTSSSRFGCLLAAFLVAFCCWPRNSLAACTSTESCLQAIAAAQRDTRTIEADFVQVKHLGLLEEPLISAGRFAFKQPDRVRLDVSKPEPATILIDGRNVRIPGLTEQQQKAVGMAPIGAMFGQLAKIFRGDVEELRKDFDVTAEAENGSVRVRLVPRRADWKRAFRSIDLRFAAELTHLDMLRLEDELGDSLEVTLRNVRRNRDLPDAFFKPSN
jgi:outer membrane lipoprotein-sorting protein